MYRVDRFLPDGMCAAASCALLHSRTIRVDSFYYSLTFPIIMPFYLFLFLQIAVEAIPMLIEKFIEAGSKGVYLVGSTVSYD